MKRLRVDLELVDDVCFSRRAATAGVHESLDYVPGSALWGYVASALYAAGHARAEDAAFRGAVLASIGLPVHPGTGLEAYPLPLAWHVDKGDARSASVRHGRMSTDVRNGVLDDLSVLGQARGLRGGFVTSRGHWLQPQRQFVLRTAVGEDGRAATAQLFGYEGLVGGAQFRAWIDVVDDLVDPVQRALNGVIRLGRSRSTEYGRVASSCHVDDSLAEEQLLPCKEGDAHQLVIWLLSDVCLHDSSGLPTLSVEALAGLVPGARVDLGRSFVRHRSFALWNAHRGAYGVERQCLSAGSVVTLVRPERPFNEDERRLLAAGLGVGREVGLGRVWINPPLLCQPISAVLKAGEADASLQAGASDAASSAAKPVVGVVEPPSALTRWVHRKVASVRRDLSVEVWVRQRLGELHQRLVFARSFAGVASDVAYGPGRSQWGLVDKTARDAGSLDKLQKALFDTKAGLLRHRAGDDWAVVSGAGSAKDSDTLALWLERQVQGLGDMSPAWNWADQMRAVCLLAAQAREANWRDPARLSAMAAVYVSREEAAT